jgi:hypothetical protein
MPPHCDSIDGPVVTAARAALAAHDVDVVLPYVPADGEAEIRDAFDATIKVVAAGAEAADLAERWFFETVVRVHRAGEGAPYTGLKPAGLDVGPVIPAAEKALETGVADGLLAVLSRELTEQVEQRLGHARELETTAGASVPQAREYVEAMLGLQVWAHAVHRQVMAPAHAHAGSHDHD